jgi:RNA polymerase sigma-70 factor (ECF subfamily)
MLECRGLALLRGPLALVRKQIVRWWAFRTGFSFFFSAAARGTAMSDDPSFDDLIQRVRQGDPAAAESLVRRFEPQVRRVVRLRLEHSPLQRHLDSVDVCQSVLASFFVRAALGQYDLDSPEALVRLLTAMARNKLADQARRLQGLPRDPVEGRAGAGDVAAAADAAASPSRVVAGRELLAAVRARLRPDELLLAERRAEGRAWADVGAELGESPEALRKRLERALARVAREVGLEEEP